MAFDINAFYKELDEYYGRFDNAATEKFLKDSLLATEEFMIVPGECSSCSDHGDYTAEEKYEKMSDAERKWILDCSDARVAVLNEMACFYRGISNWEKCIEAFDGVRVELEARGLEKSNQYAVVILNLAGAYRLMEKYDDALAAFAQAKEIMDANGNAEDYELAGLYNNTGLVYQDLNDYDKAISNFETALTYLKKVEDNDAEVATNMANLAVACYKAGKSEKANEYLDEALSVFESLDGGMNPHYAGALNTKAVIAFNMGKYEEACNAFELACEKTKLIFGENREYFIGCSNTAQAFKKLGNEAKAKEYEETAMRVYKKING